jgi:hypothetical protein
MCATSQPCEKATPPRVAYRISGQKNGSRSPRELLTLATTPCEELLFSRRGRVILEFGVRVLTRVADVEECRSRAAEAHYAVCRPWLNRNC